MSSICLGQWGSLFHVHRKDSWSGAYLIRCFVWCIWMSFVKERKSTYPSELISCWELWVGSSTHPSAESSESVLEPYFNSDSSALAGVTEGSIKSGLVLAFEQDKVARWDVCLYSYLPHINVWHVRWSHVLLNQDWMIFTSQFLTRCWDMNT